MKTEDLNEYVFANLVMKSAWDIYRRRVKKLEDANEITSEQAMNMPLIVADVQEALQVIRHNKKVVFESLAELELASAASLVNP